MRITIMSDTHGSRTAFQKALEAAGPCDLILHAGDILYHGPRNLLPEGYDPGELAQAINNLDKPFIAAAGNCDAPVDQLMLSVPVQAPYALVYLERMLILVTHGHAAGEEELIGLARQWGVKLLVTGHTHVKRLEKRNGVYLLNPGSCALPKDGSPSVAVLEDFRVHFINIESKETIQSQALL
ncbi:MAG: phosphodiesterase [Bacillota bacterium]